MSGYLLDSGSELGAQQLGYLDELIDEQSKQFIGPVTAQPGQRCLELGAGSGSIARWLAERVGTAGEVVAVDLDDAHLVVPPQVTVHVQDLNDGLPTEGPFDVIHGRLLLMHLKRRREILAELVDALAPGGWLILGELPHRGAKVISAPSEDDARLVRTVIETVIDKVGRPAGIDYEWGYELDAQLTASGLGDVDTMEFTRTTYGGTTASLLYSNYLRQLDTPARAVGISAAEITRFHELMRDPRLRLWFFPLLYSRGRKSVPDDPDRQELQ